MARKSNIKKGRSSLPQVIMRLAVAALCIYLLIGLISNEVDIAVKNRRIATLEQQIAQQQSDTVELRRLLGSGADIDAYYEKIAREKLGFAYPDEKVFVDISGN